MPDEADIMDELHGLHGELKSFPADAHWFCPKRNDEDYVDYSHPDDAEEDMSAETKKELIQDAQRRQTIAYKFSLTIGLDRDAGGAMVEGYLERLNKLLMCCDKCVHNWHIGRKAYLKELTENFDDETVAALSSRLNVLDFQRIDNGLERSKKVISEVESPMRTQKLLAGYDSSLLLSLYESLCCVDYHKSADNLSKHFDFVFEEIQAKKVLRISDILPATGRFLFDKNPIRQRFARCAWQKATTMLTPTSFDWVVHDALSDAIVSVTQGNYDYEDIIRFWEGFLLILEKLDEHLITHSLRAMEVQPSVYILALNHLSCKSERINKLVIEALRGLLKKSPKNFWAAFATISPVAVAENILRSWGVKEKLQTINFEDPETSFILAWLPELVESLPSDRQYDVCSFVLRFLGTYQTSEHPENTQLACRCAALDTLRATLNTFVDSEYVINPSTSLIFINNIMKLVDDYKETITESADLKVENTTHQEMRRLGMLVIRDALALDCKALSAEFQALAEDIPIQQGLRSHSQPIWQGVLDIFRPGNVDLAKSILAATTHLTGLDELTPKSKKLPLPSSHLQYNKDFRQLTENVSRIFERLSDFNASHLIEMYRDPQTSRPLFAALMSADQQIFEAAVEVVKAATDQISKREAISSLLGQAFVPMLNSLTFAVVRITKAKNFSPVPFLFKVGRDTLEALCGDTGGFLRTHPSLDSAERSAVMSWWINQWRALDAAFANTEAWGGRVQLPKETLQDFCRDGMEYAESLFDKNSIIASALCESSNSSHAHALSSGYISRKAAQKKVLQVVCLNVNGLTMMLRLRDIYLVSVITSLLGKLLRSLAEFDVEVHEYSLSFIQDACLNEGEKGYRKTNLTNQQKAELRAALDEHKGVEIIESYSTTAQKQQSRLDSWSKSAGGVKHEPTFSIKGRQTQTSLDTWSKAGDGKTYEPVITQSNKASQAPFTLSEHHKSIMDKMRSQPPLKTAKATEDWKDKRRRDEEEKKKRNAAAIAQAKALRAPAALVKGEGSGLKNLSGVAGKDHAPVRSEIMVGSSDEDSDDDDDDDGSDTKFLFTKSREASNKVREYEESRKKALLQATGPVRKTKKVYSKKDLRARLEPNMDIIYLELLNWDIFHEGEDPPTNNVCKKIASSFLDLGLYKETFKPLLISEVWRSLLTAKEENQFKPIEIKVLNRLSVDKFMEVSTTMSISNQRDLMVYQQDIVLLSKSSNPLQDKQAPHCLARVFRTTRKRDAVEVTYRVSRDISPELLNCFVPNGKLYTLKITDMTTTLREFAALSSLEYYDLCTEILEAKPSPLQKYSDEKVASMSTRYKLNNGQAKAILSANDNDGFTLIQGPPGSGKTKTIIAMVGALLSQVLQQQAQQVGFRPQGQNRSAGAQAQAQAPKKKLLICAPSNAAVDELVLRLKEGILPLSGSHQKINVIRVGRSDAINSSVKDVTLDELVRIKLEGDQESKKGQLNDREVLHRDAGLIKERLNVLRPEMEKCRAAGDKTSELKLQREFDELKRKQAHIGNKIDEDKESDNKVRQNEISRRHFTQEIIDGAHVLCATLSGSGHDFLRNVNVEFETVIIDEAAQCIELSALIPLKYGATKCILVGDPEQLPPTVLSRLAKSYGYEQSLFVRMQRNHPDDVHLLDTQYRMHPEISRFPSQQFYNSRLIDGDGMAQLRVQPWHASSILGPYRFFDVVGVQSKEARGHSLINVPELNAAIQLYQRLKTDYRSYDFKGKIGIITTYKAQLNELKRRFGAKFGDEIFEEIEFNTTDAFQGREREIIIFSCVRAKAAGGIGFLNDIRRMNVGLTRAKSSLWVLGDSRALEQGEFWNRLIQDAKSRERYTSGDIMGLLSRPTSKDAPAIDYSKISSDMNGNSSRRPSEKSDSDIDMTDAPQNRSSRESVSGSSSTTSVDDRNAPNNVEMGEQRKRPREQELHPDNITGKKKKKTQTSEADPAPPASAMLNRGPVEPPKLDLEAALQAQQANKAAAAAARIPKSNLPPPPRRKAPADPFIQRKPPKRK